MRFLSFLLILTIFSFSSKASELAEGECTPDSGVLYERFIEENNEPWYDYKFDRICKINGKECLSRLANVMDKKVCTKDLVNMIDKIKKAVANDDAEALSKLLVYPTWYIPLDDNHVYISSEKEFVDKYYKEIFTKDAKKIIKEMDIDGLNYISGKYGTFHYSLFFLGLSVRHGMKIEFIWLETQGNYQDRLERQLESKRRRAKYQEIKKSLSAEK